MFKRFFAVFAVFILPVMLGILAFPAVAAAEGEFLDPAEAFVLSMEKPAAKGDKLTLTWTIAPGYYLYRDRIKVEEEPSKQPVSLTLPPAERKNDPNFGEVAVYHHKVTVAVAPAEADSFTVTWQGCADAGLCYPPQKRTIALGNIGDNAQTGPAAATESAAADLTSVLDIANGSDGGFQRLLDEKTLTWTLPIFLLLGIALAFTPCVLPMVPIVSSIVLGKNTRPRQAFLLSLAFVIPMALVYAGLGVVAALAGANLQAALQNRWAISAFGILFVVLALPMFGVFTLQLPAFMRDRLDQASQRQRRGRYLGAAGMGVLSALMVGPCMTAPLAGTLLYIAQSGDTAKGALLLFTMGIGMGLPMIAVSVVGARSLPRPGLWMDRVKGGFGFLMLGVAIWMFQRVLPQTLVLVFWGVWLIGIGMTLWTIASPRKTAESDIADGLRIAVKCMAALAFLWGAASVIGAAGGATDPLEPMVFAAGKSAVMTPAGASGAFATVTSREQLDRLLVAARAEQRPALIDFYADWCVSCKALEKEVFGSEAVSRALSGMTLIRVDVTDNNPSVQALMREKGILGPPTVMLIDANGEERRNDRLVGEFKPAALLQRLHPADNANTNQHPGKQGSPA